MGHTEERLVLHDLDTGETIGVLAKLSPSKVVRRDDTSPGHYRGAGRKSYQSRGTALQAKTIRTKKVPSSRSKIIPFIRGRFGNR